LRCTHVRIDHDALLHNLSVIRGQAGQAGILAMVKANAYGHGMIEVARTLEDAGVAMLGVAFVDEGIALREAGITAPIIVLTPPLAEESHAIVEYQLVTVVGDHALCAAVSSAAHHVGATASVHLYVDTGMHRDGVPMHDAVRLAHDIERMPGVSLDGILTHFATADESSSHYVALQRERFDEVIRELESTGLRPTYRHIANTGGIWQGATYDLVRPGLSLYGYSAPAGVVASLRPVLSLHTRVASVRRIEKGAGVSYGLRYVATSETTIATIPVGYGDGYHRSLSGRTVCLIDGKRYPIVGSICMDECMVDVGNDPIRVNDDVVLLGTQRAADGTMASISAEDLAIWMGTIPYEITTAIAQRVPRIHVRK
jgi:alanine racemase